jgi:hypothetical protein
MDALSHVRNVEVQEKSELVTTQSEIGQQLSTMYGQHSLHAFDLDDETSFDDEVDTVCGRELNPLVHDRQSNFLLKVQAELGELVGEACAAGAFENSGAERTVHADRRTDDQPARFVRFLEYRDVRDVVALCVLCVLCVHAAPKQPMSRT